MVLSFYPPISTDQSNSGCVIWEHFVENVTEFERWLYEMIKDAKAKLNMTDRTLAYILLNEGMNYYLKQLKGEYGIRDAKEHN